MKRLKIFTWHVHGNYLYYLSKTPHEIFIPYARERSGDYGGKGGGFPWGGNVHEVPVEAVSSLQLDCIIFQHIRQYHEEQFRILSPEQRRLPRIYLEFEPPSDHAAALHPMRDSAVLLVHVTPYNALMWHSEHITTRTIDHGVTVPHDIRYTGELNRGIAIINNIDARGRNLGNDILSRIRREVPVDLVGMHAEDAGGIGEIGHNALASFAARYRFFFSPVRYGGLALALCGAMMIGLPVVGIATGEMATVVRSGESGYIDTNADALVPHMKMLLENPVLAHRLGRNARAYARRRFGIERFVNDWNNALAMVTGNAAVYAGVPDAQGISGEGE